MAGKYQDHARASRGYPFTLVPTVGTAFIILSANSETFVGKLLGTKQFVGVGLVSYSAYLWHQPLFAFARHKSLGEPSTILMVSLACVAVVLAYFSYKYVETPFRRTLLFSRKQVLTLGATISISFIALGLTGHFMKGFVTRFSIEQRDFMSYFDNNTPELKYFTRTGIPNLWRAQCDFYGSRNYRGGYSISDECFVRDASLKHAVFIWGDSHAEQLYPGLRKVMPSDWQILQVSSSGCEVDPKFQANQSKVNYCEFSNWFAFGKVAETKPDVVIVAQNLNHSVENMMAISERLRTVGVKKVLFTGPTPHWSTELPKIVALKFWENTPRRTFAYLDKNVVKLDTKLKSDFITSSSRMFISVMDYFCNSDGCLVFIGEDRRDGITTWDYGHLTPIASYHFARDVLVKKVVGEVN